MNRRASRILTVCAGAWLLVIWGHSCLPAAQSGAESGALLVVVQDLLPWMTDHVLRKCAHFAEYAVLGALTAAALRTSAHFSWPRALLPGPLPRCATRRSSSSSPAAAARSRTSGSTRRATSPARC